MTQARTLACEGTNLISWIVAAGLFVIAIGQAAKLYGMTKQAGREG